ncbi:MAG: hypothetical protein ACREDR_20580, partial [Blastocatellia bacterium]
LTVAQFLFLEGSRELERRSLTNADVSNVPDPASPHTVFSFDDQDDDSKSLDCLERCLARLSPDQRKLILSYYSKEGGRKIAGRKELADLLSITPSALRLRAFRIRDFLARCIEKCRNSGAGAPG